MQPTSAPKADKPRKKRQRLSCFECRKRKLYCDRKLPCQRCVKSGRAADCSFEIGARPPSTIEQEQQNSNDIRVLQTEFTELKRLLSELCSTTHQNGDLNTRIASESCVTTTQPALLHQESQAPPFLLEVSASLAAEKVVNSPHPNPEVLMRDQASAGHNTTSIIKPEISDPRSRSPSSYYTRHILFQFFNEIPNFFPFIRDTAREWFEPLGIQLVKQRWAGGDRGATAPFWRAESMESLLPPKGDTDMLVSFYLDCVEQVHRIVHIPTLRREYDKFWEPRRPRHPAMTTLILSIISISACLAPCSAESISLTSQHRSLPAQWISACEDWLRQQSPKHRKLVHYQITCLLYLAKRVNIIRKKTWWKETGSVIQDAIMDGIHSEGALTSDRPYTREMKRRIWTVIRELDLQNAFDFGLPTLLYNIDSNIQAPTNINDESFDDTVEELPASNALTEYTSVSYQVHSHRSWTLRLVISRRLMSAGLSKSLPYDDVLRYTHELVQEIAAIPLWDGTDAGSENGAKRSAVAHEFLHFQLQGYILALHRPFLQRNDGRYWLSENVSYQTARDMLVRNHRLMSLGLQSLTAIREDVLLASLSLARVTLLQPEGSMSSVMLDSQSTINILEQCLPFEEERYLRCFHEEPWCFLTMCGAIMIVKIHLREESRQMAKASCARKFLDLYYKHAARQTTPIQVQHSTTIESQTHSEGQDPSTIEWPSCSFLEPDFEDLGPGLNLHSIWDDWNSSLQIDPQV